MLFFCRWDGTNTPASLLVDATDETNAREIAEEEGGTAPDTVKPVPLGVFAAEVYFDDDGEPEPADDAVLVLEPLEHTLDALAALENGEASDLASVVCGVEALGDDETIVRCELAPNHDGAHTAGDLSW